ncbi:MAG: 4Fe-4S binding protein [Bacteroidales bacterium]|nr:4Fe-4S binding protein [Bacteroidales bacterium]
MEDIRKYLIDKVLLTGSDAPSDEVRRQLQLITRDTISKPVVYISSGTSSLIAGSDKTQMAVTTYLSEMDISAEVVNTGCSGPSNFEPLICIHLPGKNKLVFRNITEERVDSLLNAVFHNDIPDEDLVGQSGSRGFGTWHGIPFLEDHPWFALQKRLILSNCGCYDPCSISEYIARGGYRTYVKTIRNYTPEEVCDIIERSGLRGRSGGGFITGTKWKYALNTPASGKYVICNARESDPGGYTDRTILESDPHRLIEGLALAAYGVGATTAYFYIRSGSSRAIEILEKALEQVRDYGLSGHNIFSSGFNLEIFVAVDAGAFVCGEETALIRSLEGKRGMPELKPPYPTTSGLFGKPTVINNVETLMNVPLIMQNGPEWFRGTGTETSSGTKVFALAGKARLTGIVEVEMGTSLRRVIEGIAGGIKEGRDFKALQLGGATGTFITEDQLDTCIGYEELKDIGSGLGAGSFVVIDDSICMVDMVRYYMDFMHHESCGKCIPCREGTGRMLEILDGVVRRPANDEASTTLERFKGVMQLEAIASVMKDTSLCGLGQNAPNPFLSAMNNFREEFEEHIFDRKCRSNVCKGLRTFSIDVEKCTGCTACASKCPVNAIYGTRLQPFFIVEDKCIGCGACYDVCKFSAISVK